MYNIKYALLFILFLMMAVIILIVFLPYIIWECAGRLTDVVMNRNGNIIDALKSYNIKNKID